MNAANTTGVSMLDMKIRMTEPAAVSAISSGDERRATSAICTPFQPDTAMPANADSSRNAHSGQSGALSASAMVEIAEPTEAIVSVVGARRDVVGDPAQHARGRHAGRLHHREHQARRAERQAERNHEIGRREGDPAGLRDRQQAADPRDAPQPARRATASATAPRCRSSRKLTSRAATARSRGGSMRDRNGQVSA